MKRQPVQSQSAPAEYLVPCAAVLDTAAEQNQIQLNKLKVQPCPELSSENSHLSFPEVQDGRKGEEHDGLHVGCPVHHRRGKHLPCAQIYKQTCSRYSRTSTLTTRRRLAVPTAQWIQHNLLSTAATVRGPNCSFYHFPLIVASRAVGQILHIFAGVLFINKAVLGSLSNKRHDKRGVTHRIWSILISAGTSNRANLIDCRALVISQNLCLHDLFLQARRVSQTCPAYLLYTVAEPRTKRPFMLPLAEAQLLTRTETSGSRCCRGHKA